MSKAGIKGFAHRHRILVSVLSVIAAAGISGGIFIFRGAFLQAGRFGYAGVFFLSMLGHATILLPMPALLGAFIGGGIFHPLVIGVIAAAGAAIGELTGYLAGVGGNAIISDRKVFRRMQDQLQRYGLVGLVVLAAIPNPLFDMAGIAAGMMRLRISHFLLATWVGQIIKFTVFSYLGAGSSGLLNRYF